MFPKTEVPRKRMVYKWMIWGAHPYFWKHLVVVFLEVLKPGQLFWDVKVSPGDYEKKTPRDLGLRQQEMCVCESDCKFFVYIIHVSNTYIYISYTIQKTYLILYNLQYTIRNI